MAFNHAYGGVIGFPPDRWADWYARWVDCQTGERFYRYLKDVERYILVGEVSYHLDGELGGFICDVIVPASLRGRGYGAQGLALLCGAARANGVARLYDDLIDLLFRVLPRRFEPLGNPGQRENAHGTLLGILRQLAASSIIPLQFFAIQRNVFFHNLCLLFPLGLELYEYHFLDRRRDGSAYWPEDNWREAYGSYLETA